MHPHSACFLGCCCFVCSLSLRLDSWSGLTALPPKGQGEQVDPVSKWTWACTVYISSGAKRTHSLSLSLYIHISIDPSIQAISLCYQSVSQSVWRSIHTYVRSWLDSCSQAGAPDRYTPPWPLPYGQERARSTHSNLCIHLSIHPSIFP